MKGNGLNPVAKTGFASAAAYDKNRPSYSNAVLNKLLSQLLLHHDDDDDYDGGLKTEKKTKVLDLAAGTGKLTELLAAVAAGRAAELNKYANLEIIAVEPHDGMREQLEKKQLENVTVVSGTAEDMSGIIEDGSIAAVTVAQAFHWFANADALKEIHRVLQPGGGLGMVWNIEDYNAPRSWKIHEGWESVMRDLIWSLDDSLPRFRHEKWKQAFASQGQSNNSNNNKEILFSLPLGEYIEEFETWLSKEDTWNRLRTLSQLAILEGEELKRVRGIFDQAINSDETVTDDQGRVAIHGRTYLAWTRSIPSKSAS